MFTGIIEGLGTITAVQSSGQGRRLSLASDFNLDQRRLPDGCDDHRQTVYSRCVPGNSGENDTWGRQSR